MTAKTWSVKPPVSAYCSRISPARLVHQEPIEDVGRLIDRGRDGLRGEGPEPVREMGVGLEARRATVSRVDEVHRFSLARGREELPVARGREPRAPEPSHGELRLRLDHHGQGPVYRLALDMPAREPGELEEVMAVGGLGHLAEAQIEPFGKQNVQKPDPVPARRACAQMRERVGETDGRIRLQQDIGDPHFGKAAIEVEHELIGFGRRVRSQTFEAQGSAFDSATRNRSLPCGSRQSSQPLIQTGFALGKPGLRFEGNRKPACSADCRNRHESLLQVAVAARVREPQIARAEGIAHVEQHCHLPEPIIACGTGIQAISPFRARAQESRRPPRGSVADDGKRGDKGLRHRRTSDIQRPKHARGVAPEPAIAVHDMGQGIGPELVGQLRGRGHELLKRAPAARCRNRVLQRRVVLFRLEKGRSEVPERAQRGVEVFLRVRHAEGTQPLRLAPGPPHDAVVGFHDGIGNGSAPFENADRQYGETPFIGEFPYAVGKIAFPLSTEPGDSMRGNAGENLGRKAEACQELQPVEQPVDVGRVPAHLELAEPYEAGEPSGDLLGRERIETRAHGIVETTGDAGLDPALGGHQRIGAAPRDDRYAGQDDLPAPALCRKAAHQLLAGAGILGCRREPGCHLARLAAREHPVAVDRPERLEMLLSRLAASGVSEQGVAVDPELGADKAQHGFGDDFAGRQEPARIPQGTELKREPDPVFGAPTLADMFEIVIGQDVVLQERGLVGRQVEQGGALTCRQNGAVGHVTFASKDRECVLLFSIRDKE